MIVKTELKKSVAVLAAVVALAAPGTAFAQADGSSSLASADRMIAQCLDYAATQKLTPLSVAVVDPSGTLVAFKRQPGAASVTAEAALLKARTAARLNAPTAVLGPAVADDGPTRDTFLILQLTTIPGGVPFADANAQLAGAVGVSGSAPDQDAACAARAIEPSPARRK
ncbi:MAG TPA: heme-binding protein [Fontimonas sp.]